MKKHVLFVCTGNSCRSQMAEAFVNHFLSDRFEAVSAGTEPSSPNPLALQVLEEIGLSHKGARSKHLTEFDDRKFDHVITLCDHANESCPVYFGNTKREHLGFDDPAKASGSPDEIIAEFRRVRDEIGVKVMEYLQKQIISD